MKLNKVLLSILIATTLVWTMTKVFANEMATQVEVSKDEVASFIGHDIGEYLSELFDPNSPNGVFDPEQRQVLLNSLNAAFSGDSTSFAEQDRYKYMEKMSQLVEQKAQLIAAQNSAQWTDFVASVINNSGKKKAKNATTYHKLVVGEGDEAQTMYYNIVTQGSGAKPTADDTVIVNYVGRVIKKDATGNFLSGDSFDQGEQTELGVSWLIPGWSAALKAMPVGSTWELYIPSELGYGEWGAGANIPPGAALFFEIELVDIAEVNDVDNQVSDFDFSELN